jgi:hypothetical protein
MTDDQRAVRVDDLKPASEVLVKREISEGLETIDNPHRARNGDVQPVVRDSANRDFKQHKVKRIAKPEGIGSAIPMLSS